MLAVHGGAGFKVLPNAHLLCGEAIRPSNCDVVKAVTFLENQPTFNCGVGSNLTWDGTVECEAGYMSSQKYSFGAVGAVSRIPFPSQVAQKIAHARCEYDLIPPLVLVGTGAENWAHDQGFPMCSGNHHHTDEAVRNWKKARSLIESNVDSLKIATDISDGGKLDTVGGVSISDTGHAEACTSSGGMILKRPGRLGHCTVFGSGVWAEQLGKRSIAISVSGCGETLVKTDFCRALSKAVLQRAEHLLPIQIVSNWFHSEFLNSSILSHLDVCSDRILAGGLLLLREDNYSELIVFHNTPTLPFAYKSETGIKKRISKMKDGSAFICDSFVL